VAARAYWSARQSTLPPLNCSGALYSRLPMPAVVVGATVLTELRRVLRQKLRVPADTVEEMDALLRRHAVVVNNAPALALKLRDKSDVPVLAEAIAGGADVLVTGERDLLNIADKPLLPILTPRGFWEWLRAAPASDE